MPGSVIISLSVHGIGGRATLSAQLGISKGESFGQVTLSPQIVRLDQVLKVKKSLLKVFQVSDCRMTLKNLVSGSRLPKSIPGIWSRRAEDFNRYGSGGCCVIVYATTLLPFMSAVLQLDTTNAIPGMS